MSSSESGVVYLTAVVVGMIIIVISAVVGSKFIDSSRHTSDAYNGAVSRTFGEQ